MSNISLEQALGIQPQQYRISPLKKKSKPRKPVLDQKAMQELAKNPAIQAYFKPVVTERVVKVGVQAERPSFYKTKSGHDSKFEELNMEALEATVEATVEVPSSEAPVEAAKSKWMMVVDAFNSLKSTAYSLMYSAAERVGVFAAVALLYRMFALLMIIPAAIASALLQMYTRTLQLITLY